MPDVAQGFGKPVGLAPEVSGSPGSIPPGKVCNQADSLCVSEFHYTEAMTRKLVMKRTVPEPKSDGVAVY